MKKILLTQIFVFLFTWTFAQLSGPGPCNIESVTPSHATCNDNTGYVVINAQGGSILQYSIDGIHYQDNNRFDDLLPSEYVITILDGDGCTDTTTVTIEPAVPFLITKIDTTDPPCTSDDYSIIISTSGGVGEIQYSLNSSPYQVSNKFPNLIDGIYELDVLDDAGCTIHMEVAVKEIYPLNVGLLYGFPTYCNADNGSILIVNPGGVGVPMFSLDQIHYQPVPEFLHQGPGYHDVYAMDDAGCTAYGRISVHQFFTMTVRKIVPTTADCGVDNGSIRIEAEGSGQLRYSINGGPLQLQPSFENLPSGDYEVLVKDQNECIEKRIVRVPGIGCEIYFPNTFSPNGDGKNDFFQLSTTSDFKAIIEKYLIFDRWGNLVYKASGFPISSTELWWDGTSKNITVSPGVFAYYIEIEYETGEVKVHKGNITVLK